MNRIISRLEAYRCAAVVPDGFSPPPGLTDYLRQGTVLVPTWLVNCWCPRRKKRWPKSSVTSILDSGIAIALLLSITT